MFHKQLEKTNNKPEDSDSHHQHNTPVTVCRSSTMILTGLSGPPAVKIIQKTGKQKTPLDNVEQKIDAKRNSTTVYNAMGEIQKKSLKTLQKIKKQYGSVDRVFLFLTPLLFIIFNIIYWGFFMW